jgi:hypothetical protein
MALPDVSVTIQDGQLGILASSTSNIAVKLGVSSLGTANTLYSFADKTKLSATLGTGPMVEAAALSLDTAGGPIYCMPVNSSVAGTWGAVTHVGTSTTTLTLTGAPLDGYSLLVTIVTGNALVSSGLVTFTYSLDGGNTTSALISLPAGGTYAIPGTGTTLNFTLAFTAVAADTFTAAATAPSYSGTDLTNAINALLTNPLVWGFVHIVGSPSSAAASATLVATVDTLLASAATQFRYAFAVMDCAKDTDANILTAFAAVSSKRVLMGAGTAFLTSSISGLIRERSAGWLAAARCAQVSIHEDLGRVATGPVIGIPAVVAGGASGLVRDEQVTPALDAARLMTLRTIIGKQGFYITNGNMVAPTGSDFGLVQRRRVMDVACSTSRQGLLQYLNDSVRVNSGTGLILESEAQSIEAYVGGLLNTALVAAGHASAAFIHIDRTHNILSDSTMPVTVSVVPLGYLKAISESIGFVNPALVPH